MGHKVTVNPTGLPDGSSFTPSLNSNLATLANEFDKVVYKDGSESMEGDLDMDSNRIINLPAPVNNTEPLRLADVEALSGDIVINDNSTTVTNPATNETHTFSNGPRIFATVFAEAELMAEDLSEMVGFADYYNVTGGTGQTTYWVDNMSDDANISGSVRWAIDQATANGGGKILISPRGKFMYFPKSSLVLPGNTTFDAPGRNFKIMCPGDIAVMDCRKKNWIIRRIKFERVGHKFEADQIRDTIFISPADTLGNEADLFWIHDVTIERAGDGAIDCTSGKEPSTRCAGTISNVHFVDCDKTMSWGFSGCYSSDGTLGNPPAWCDLSLDQTPKFWLTIYHCNFDNCDQRQPRVAGLTYVDAVNNIHTITPAKRDDGTFGAGSGNYVLGGGRLYSRGELFRAGIGSGYVAINPEATPLAPSGGGLGATGGIGATKNSGSQVEDAITIVELNATSITEPPYTLAATAVPAVGTARDDWVRTIEAVAGSEIDTAPDGEWIPISALGSYYPDGQTVIERDGAYYVRKSRTEVLNEVDGGAGTNGLINFERGANQTIVGGVLTLPAAGQYFSVLPETGTTDDLVSIAGTGRLLILRGSSGANTITIQETGNIALTGATCVLDSNTDMITLIYDTTSALWFEVSRSV